MCISFVKNIVIYVLFINFYIISLYSFQYLLVIINLRVPYCARRCQDEYSRSPDDLHACQILKCVKHGVLYLALFFNSFQFVPGLGTFVSRAHAHSWRLVGGALRQCVRTSELAGKRRGGGQDGGGCSGRRLGGRRRAGGGEAAAVAAVQGAGGAAAARRGGRPGLVAAVAGGGGPRAAGADGRVDAGHGGGGGRRQGAAAGPERGLLCVRPGAGAARAALPRPR